MRSLLLTEMQGLMNPMTAFMRRDRQAGFSITELLMVLAAVVVIIGLSVPMLASAMRDIQLSSDVRNIATTLSYAKMNSTSEMTHCRLVLDLDDNLWSMEKLNKSTSNFELQEDTYFLSSGIGNSGITFEANFEPAPSGFPMSSSSVITFNSHGIPVDGSGVPTTDNIIYISNAENEYAVTVSLSGKVQIWRFENNRWTAQ